jgi:hypothetical protein
MLNGTGARNNAHAGVGVSENGAIARRESHIAGENELAACAACTASDLRDRDLLQCAQPPEKDSKRRLQHGACQLLPHLVQPGHIEVADETIRNRAAKYDDPYVIVGLHVLNQIDEITDHRLAQQVEWRGIQRCKQNPALESCFDGFQVQHRDILRITSPSPDWNVRLADVSFWYSGPFSPKFRRFLPNRNHLRARSGAVVLLVDASRLDCHRALSIVGCSVELLLDAQVSITAGTPFGWALKSATKGFAFAGILTVRAL